MSEKNLKIEPAQELSKEDLQEVTGGAREREYLKIERAATLFRPKVNFDFDTMVMGGSRPRTLPADMLTLPAFDQELLERQINRG